MSAFFITQNDGEIFSIFSSYFNFLFAVTGTLKGYDQLLNLVLDEAVEFLRGK